VAVIDQVEEKGSGESSCIVLVAQTALERIAAYSLDFVESLDKDFIKVVAGEKGAVEACRKALPASGTPFELLKIFASGLDCPLPPYLRGVFKPESVVLAVQAPPPARGPGRG